jgi:hypothetical protein
MSFWEKWRRFFREVDRMQEEMMRQLGSPDERVERMLRGEFDEDFKGNGYIFKYEGRTTPDGKFEARTNYKIIEGGKVRDATPEEFQTHGLERVLGVPTRKLPAKEIKYFGIGKDDPDLIIYDDLALIVGRSSHTPPAEPKFNYNPTDETFTINGLGTYWAGHTDLDWNTAELTDFKENVNTFTITLKKKS